MSIRSRSSCFAQCRGATTAMLHPRMSSGFPLGAHLSFSQTGAAAGSLTSGWIRSGAAGAVLSSQRLSCSAVGLAAKASGARARA